MRQIAQLILARMVRIDELPSSAHITVTIDSTGQPEDRFNDPRSNCSKL